MKIKLFTIASAIVLTGCASPSTSTEEPESPAVDGALTGYELTGLMSGARMYGPSAGTPGATFEQSYPDISLGQKKGKAKGKWNENGQVSDYKISWFVKDNRWCEKWDDGSSCWDVVPTGGNEYQFYKNGSPLDATWMIDSPKTRPIRQTSDLIAADFSKRYVEKGEWSWRDGGERESGTYEAHGCGDMTSIGMSSHDGVWSRRTHTVKSDDTHCTKYSRGTYCYKTYQDQLDPNKVHFVRTDGKVTGFGITETGTEPARCDT